MSIAPGLIERQEQRSKALSEGMKALEKRGAKVLEARQTKVCTRCKNHRPLTAFNKRPRSRDGLQAWCRTCNIAYQKDQRCRQREELERLKKLEKVVTTERQKLAGQVAKGLAHAMAFGAASKQELPIISEWQSQVDQGQDREELRNTALIGIGLLCGAVGMLVGFVLTVWAVLRGWLL